MAAIDFRECLYALSDVITNRPPPLRVFDQIYMKLPDMLLQTEFISRRFRDRSGVFIGDGDAIALSLAHLSKLGLLPGCPRDITAPDFDERVVNSVNHFSRLYGLEDKIHAELYNVADPLPRSHRQSHDAFYTNPPWGASNLGESVCCFVGRGIEAMGTSGVGCIVIGNHPRHSWTHRVQAVTQSYVMASGFRIAEMLPEFHRDHLDDDPDLTSCCMLISRNESELTLYGSKPLTAEQLQNFYGANSPLKVRYVRDLLNAGKLASRDLTLELF